MNKKFQEYMEKTPTPKAQKPQCHRFGRLTTSRVLVSLLGIQGLVCILFTDWIHSVFPYILGGTMSAMGLFDIYRGIVTAEFKRPETKLTSNGIVMLSLGIIILIHSGNADAIIGSVWGAIGLFKGSEELNMAIYHRFSNKAFAGEAIHAIVELILAFVLLIDPLTAVKHHLFILGLELVWHSIKLFKENKSLR